MRGRRSFLSIWLGKLWPLAIAGVFCVIALSSGPVHALLDPSKYSDTERVGFAFSKLGNVPPDYNAWIDNMEVYKNAPPIDRQPFHDKTVQRLQEGFYNYTSEDDMIRIVADVTIRWERKDF